MPWVGAKPGVLRGSHSHWGVMVKSHGARKAKRVRARIRPIVMAMAYQLELILKRATTAPPKKAPDQSEYAE